MLRRPVEFAGPALPGTARVGEVDVEAGVLRHGLVVGELHPAIPGQRSPHLLGQQIHFSREAGRDGLHVAPIDLNQNGEPCRALDDRRDLGPLTTEEKVSFPVSGDCAVRGLSRALGNRDGVLDLGAPLPRDVVVNAPTDRPAGSQMLLQLLRENAAGLYEQRFVDRLV